MALKLCETHVFHVIFLDQYMASVDKQLLGTETARAMRTKGVKKKICGLSANDLRDSLINAGADDFILKPMPCKPADLKQVLLKILKTSVKNLSVSEHLSKEPFKLGRCSSSRDPEVIDRGETA